MTIAADSDRDPGAAGRRRMNPDERRSEIVEAAKDVYFSLGYAGTSFRAVATSAGVSESLVYRYFSSKEELFDAAIRQPLEELLQEIEAASAAIAEGSSDDDQTDRLDQFHQQMLTLIAKLTPYLGLALFAEREDSIRFYVERMRPLLWSTTQTLLASAGARSRETDPMIAMTAFFGMYWGVDVNAILRGRDPDVRATSAQLARLLTHGLRGAPN